MTAREYRQHKLARKRREHIAFVKRSIITFVLLCVVMLGMSLVTTIRANASDIDPSQTQEEPTKEVYKYYRQVYVSEGDTLYGIASRNLDHTYYTDTDHLISEIQAINGLESEMLLADSIILVPYYDTALK